MAQFLRKKADFTIMFLLIFVSKTSRENKFWELLDESTEPCLHCLVVQRSHHQAKLN